MFKKLLPWLIIVLVAITLIIFAAFILWNFLGDNASNDPASQVNGVEAKPLPAEQVKALTFEIKDILTNLSTKEYLKISFAFQLENEDALKEFTLLDFKVKSIIIRTLADLTPEDISGSKGNDFLTTTLMNQINPILVKGKVIQISITDFVLT